MTNEQKKRYLLRYRDQVLLISRIESKIEEIRSMKISPSAKPNDGMPHGHHKNDLSNYAAHIDELERDLMEQKELLIKCFFTLEKQIGLLEDEREKSVLHFRYIKGLSWYEIAEMMNYTERWIHEIHSKALHNFEIPANNA